jgi:hypothetical protein
MKPSRQFVVCVKNEGYSASLEKRKIYVALRDPAAEKHGQLRIIDESGDDYLYPKAFFRSIALPQSIKKAVLAAARRWFAVQREPPATRSRRRSPSQTPCRS